MVVSGELPATPPWVVQESRVDLTLLEKIPAAACRQMLWVFTDIYIKNQKASKSSSGRLGLAVENASIMVSFTMVDRGRQAIKINSLLRFKITVSHAAAQPIRKQKGLLKDKLSSVQMLGLVGGFCGGQHTG